MKQPSASTILVVGGSGYFGSLLVADLLTHTDSHIVIAGRRRELAEQQMTILLRDTGAEASRIETAACDLARRETLDGLVRRCAVAVCAAGPFQDLPLTLLESCVEHGTPYLDLSDDRAFVRRVCEWVGTRAAGSELPPICTAWSAVSALSCALARIGAQGWSRIDAMRVFIAPGNRQPRNRGTVASLLASLGRPFDVPSRGGVRRVTGWSQPRDFPFPAPVGTRRGWLVDVPDHDLAPRWLGARTVEFRVGAEVGLFNHGASMLAGLRRAKLLGDLAALVGLSCASMALLGPLGSDAGAVGVEIEGAGPTGDLRQARVSVVAEHRGPVIAILPAAIMIERLAAEASDPPPGGLVRHDDWIGRADLDEQCRRRGIRLVVEESPMDSPAT